MKKYVVLSMMLISSSVCASETKVICGNDKDLSYKYDNDDRISAINIAIAEANKHGFNKASALIAVNANGTTSSFCVLVTKP